jgi:hypothetical protein
MAVTLSAQLRACPRRAAPSAPPPAAALPAPTARRTARRGGVALTQCAAAGFDAFRSSSEGAFGDEQAAAPATPRVPRPTPRSDAPPLTNKQMNQRIVDGGLQRNQALPLPLTHPFARLPADGSVRKGTFWCTLCTLGSCAASASSL